MQIDYINALFEMNLKYVVWFTDEGFLIGKNVLHNFI